MNYPDRKSALRAQADREFRETFIAENTDFIKSAAAKTLHHFVTEHDDEWSVALIAFNEAIDSYIEERGEFSTFAGVVINRRLTDELRKVYRTGNEIPTSFDTMEGRVQEDETSFQTEVRSAVAKEAEDRFNSGAHSAKDEIEAVQKILQKYGFSFFDLADCSPKAAKTKVECAKAVGVLLTNEELFREMQRTRSLPLREIIAISGVKRKTIDRHRRYIIAAAEILNGEYPLLAAYMDYIRKALQT